MLVRKEMSAVEDARLVEARARTGAPLAGTHACIDTAELARLRKRYTDYAILKRTFDIVNSCFQLIVFSPLFLAAAVAIKLTDGGPVLFAQQRLTGGPGGPRVFRILKFRTMVVNAEQLGAKITGKRDPRITPAGRILRGLKLDELPQLINILRGEMSFVGPRPQTLGYVEQFREHYHAIHSVVPAGLTDLATLKYRDEARLLEEADDQERFYCEVIMPDKIAYHYKYLEHIGIGQDVSILAQTVYHVFVVKPWRKLTGRRHG
jgi:lipopolysaccharide/colanic/teichoic acid biosynthesis glycosyltransferase